MELYGFLLVIRNVPLPEKKKNAISDKPSTLQHASANIKVGPTAGVPSFSQWLENKFHLMRFDFLSCGRLLSPPPLYTGSTEVVPCSCRNAINPSGTEGNDACYCEHTRWGPEAENVKVEQQSFYNEM